jgi:hypothetical protein
MCPSQSSNIFSVMNTSNTQNELDYETANQLCDDLWNEDGDGQIGLSEAHTALGFKWDGKDESEFETIIETFKELFKTHVSIDVENECVNLIGAVDEDED